MRKLKTIAAASAFMLAMTMFTACGRNDSSDAQSDTSSATTAAGAGGASDGNMSGSDEMNAGRSRDIDGDGIVEDIVSDAGDIVDDVVTGADKVLDDLVPGETDSSTMTTDGSNTSEGQ